jgi:wyosine [tRNA(Phe)-imidazoG37] synthetase (radical SAM superfamily)
MELFLLQGVNTSEEDLAGLAAEVARIGPQRVQLNTAVRPTAERGAQAVPAAMLQEWAMRFGPNAEVIAEHAHDPTAGAVAPAGSHRKMSDAAARIHELCRRHPCTMADLARLEGVSEGEARGLARQLIASGSLHVAVRDGREYLVTEATVV